MEVLLSTRVFRSTSTRVGTFDKAFKKERLESKHLNSVIDIANDFEDYLVKTKGHSNELWP